MGKEPLSCLNIEIALRHSGRHEEAELVHIEIMKLLKETSGHKEIIEGIEREIAFKNSTRDKEGKLIESEHKKRKLVILDHMLTRIKDGYQSHKFAWWS